MSLPPEKPLRGILYVSRAREEMDRDAIDRLVEAAAVNNQQIGVTGLLCFKRGRFLQYIEGPSEAALALMERINADDRHEVVRTIDQYPVPSRRFSTWSMRLMNESYLSSITLEDVIFGNVNMKAPNDPEGRWWSGFAWRVVDKLAKLHAKEVF